MQINSVNSVHANIYSNKPSELCVIYLIQVFYFYSI